MKRLALVLSLLSALAFGQGVLAPPNTALKVVNGFMTPIANATITVCAANTGGIPCSPATVSIFSDAGLTHPLSNPFTSDAFGNYQFAATAAQYTVTVTALGFAGNSYQISLSTGGGGGGNPSPPFSSLQANSSGSFGAVPGASVNFSTGQFNVLLPSVGGTSIEPSWDIGTIATANYAPVFNWSQSPAGSISIGSNTVTINAVRGITAFSASPGISGFYTKHYLYLATTGTPEAVLLTGTTCTGASTGTCTVTFTAANSHSAGYTLGSATAGYQEAYIDAFLMARAQSLPAPGGSMIGGVKVYGRSTDFPVFNAPFYIDSTQGTIAPIVIDFGGTTVVCNTSGTDCLRVGSGVGAAPLGPQNATIVNGNFTTASGFVRTANGTSVAVHDAAQNVKLHHLNFVSYTGIGTSVFDYLIDIDGDQHADIGWVDTHVGNNPPMKCDTTWCGAAIFAPQSGNSSNGQIHDSDLTMGCTGAMFDWESGNGLTIRDNIFQNWPIYPWRYGPGLVDITDLGHNYYEGVCSNPELGINAGTGPQYFGNHVLMENNWSPGFGSATNFTQFSNTGSNVYAYYIVGINGSGFQTAALMLGTASTNGSTNYTMKWPDFGATSYTVLRAGPLALDGTDTAPFGTANWQVASGITCSGTPHICSFTETFAAPTSFSVGGSQWVPTIGTADQTLRYWPAPLFLGTQSANACVLYEGIGVATVNDCLFGGGGGSYYTAIYTGPGVGGGNSIAINGAQSVTGVRAWIPDSMQSSSATGKAGTGAMILPPVQATQVLTGLKGRINFSNLWNLTSHDSDLFTFYDDNYQKTLNAGPGHQPTNDPGDSAIGFDTSPKYLAFRGNTAISFYIGQKFNSGGAGMLARFTTAGLALGTHLNQSATGQIAGTCVFSASTTCSIVYGTAFTSTPIVMLTPVNPGAVTFTLTSTSNTGFTITGSGSNSLTVNWSAIGNPN